MPLPLRPLSLLALMPLAGAAEWTPRWLLPDQKIFVDDFSEARELKALPAKSPLVGAWNPNQGTRWKVEGGMLKGEASTAEYQASHDTHKGVHPRIALTKTPADYILEFSLRVVDGKPFVPDQRRSVPPFIEIGHHICRVTWGENGAMLLADGDTIQLDVAKEFKLEAGKWHRVMVERRADEVVVQFQDGPTFHGKHPSYRSDLHAVMLGGLEAGHLEVDDVTVWSIKPGEQPGWADWLKQHPAPKEVRLKEAKPVATDASAPAKK
jgi:hypothetical protein